MKSFFILALIIPLYSSLYAGGISTSYVDVTIQNLSINTEYNHNKPIRVTNTSKKKIRVVIKVEVPQKGTLKPGAEPIPDINWLKVVPNQYILGAGNRGSSDVIINIPKIKKLAGRTFQVNFEICGYSLEQKGGVSVVPTLITRLRFSVKK